MPDIPNDYVPLLAQTLAVVGVIAAAVLTALFTWLTRLSGRLRRMEIKDRLSWMYIRMLHDFIYKHVDTDKHELPEPPAGLFEATE